jgi:butyryl-CoA dehydrogenase
LALALYCARLVDEQHTGSAEAADAARLLLEVLTPIAKSWPSEWCLEGNSLAIQVHGGYGYTRDFLVEQYWRDQRLNMIHEGTHGIQALDLLGRKVVMEDGAGLTLLSRAMRRTAERAGPALAAPAQALTAALARVAEATRLAWSGGDAGATLANATPYLQAFGHLVLAWIWLDVAIASPHDDDASCGRRQACRYFFDYELPKIDAWLSVVAARNPTCRDMRDAWF